MVVLTGDGCLSVQKNHMNKRMFPTSRHDMQQGALALSSLSAVCQMTSDVTAHRTTA